MILENRRGFLLKLFFLFLAFFICATTVKAEQISVTSFNQDVVKSYIKTIILADFKDLIDPTLTTIIKTEDLFNNIPKDVHYVFIDFAKPKTFLGKILIDIVFLSEDNKIVLKHKCLVESSLTGKVYVANRKLRKNSIIREADIQLMEHDITSVLFAYISNKNQIIGKQTKNRMVRGIPFTDKWIEIAPVIHRGDPVFVLVKSPGYEIKCEGIALQAGNIGDMVQLKSSLSKKILRGEILNEKSILVTTN